VTTNEDLVPEVVGEEMPQELLPVMERLGTDVDREVLRAHLADAARLVRRCDLQMVHAAGLGHVGGEFSVIDILVTLYLHSMNISPASVDDPERDRLILSKGHAAAALYSTLAVSGYLPPGELRTFMQPMSQLNGHPANTKLAAVEASTGPLGHGLPIAVGAALAARLDGSPRRVFVICGDGEMQEGSNWEAIMTAAHHSLSNLCLVVDRNMLQQGARVEDTNSLEPLDDKLRAFGFDVVVLDGHDHLALADAFAAVPSSSGRPTAVVARTLKGHPISFMSDNVAWHHKVPSTEQVQLALAELELQ
jgi:transketolase